MNLSQIKEAIYSEAINSAAITVICLSVVANQCTGCMIEPQYRTFLSGLEVQKHRPATLSPHTRPCKVTWDCIHYRGKTGNQRNLNRIVRFPCLAPRNKQYLSYRADRNNRKQRKDYVNRRTGRKLSTIIRPKVTKPLSSLFGVKR